MKGQDEGHGLSAPRRRLSHTGHGHTSDNHQHLASERPKSSRSTSRGSSSQEQSAKRVRSRRRSCPDHRECREQVKQDSMRAIAFGSILEAASQGHLRLFDPRINLTPWGFKDPDTERKYQKDFLLTFVSNNKIPLQMIMISIFTLHCATSLRSVSDFRREQAFLGRLNHVVMGVRMLLSAYVSVGLGRHTLDWFSKAVMRTWLLGGREVAFIFATLDHCQPHCDLRKVIAGTIAVAILPGTWLSGSWPVHTTITMVMCWVPVLDTFFLRPDLHKTREQHLFIWLGSLLVASIVGPLFGAYLHVHRRRFWYRKGSPTFNPSFSECLAVCCFWPGLSAQQGIGIRQHQRKSKARTRAGPSCEGDNLGSPTKNRRKSTGDLRERSIDALTVLNESSENESKCSGSDTDMDSNCEVKNRHQILPLPQQAGGFDVTETAVHV